MVTSGRTVGFHRWRARAAAFALLAALSGGWLWFYGIGTREGSATAVVAGHAVDTGIVPTRTEASSTSPQIFHPQQAGKPASSAGAGALTAYSVHLGADEESGTAVLGASLSTARTYLAGAILENGAVLAEIRADSVVLELDGQWYTLYVPGAGPPSTSQITLSQANDAVRLDRGPGVQRPAAPSRRLEEMIRYTPAHNGDKPVGLSLYPGAQGSHFEQWGLRRGDVLLSLGDVPGSDVERLAERLRSLAEGHSLLAKVRRGSAEIEVLLDGGDRQ